MNTELESAPINIRLKAAPSIAEQQLERPTMPPLTVYDAGYKLTITGTELVFALVIAVLVGLMVWGWS